MKKLKMKIIGIIAVSIMFFGVSSLQAQNPYGVGCTEDSNFETVLVPIVCNGISFSIEVDICYNCSPLPGENFGVGIPLTWQPEYNPNLANCNWLEQVENYLTSWDFLQGLCPSYFTGVPPCQNSNILVHYTMPLCWKWHHDNNGNVTMKTCQTVVECYCVHAYSYCYVNGVIVETLESTGTYNNTNPGAPCPTTGEDDASCNCQTKTIDDVTVPTTPGDSECFSICY